MSNPEGAPGVSNHLRLRVIAPLLLVTALAGCSEPEGTSAENMAAAFESSQQLDSAISAIGNDKCAEALSKQVKTDGTVTFNDVPECPADNITLAQANAVTDKAKELSEATVLVESTNDNNKAIFGAGVGAGVGALAIGLINFAGSAGKKRKNK